MDELHQQVEELRASLARVVAAADAQRRGFERDLHDGAQQQLVALAVNLQLARRLAASDPTASKTLIEEIGHDVREALTGVRQLAWRIYPSLLLDRGLADALRQVASDSVVPMGIEAKSLDRLPVEIEATVYFSCLEILRIAEAGERFNIRVRQRQGAVVFDVVVDGVDVEQWAQRDLTGVSDRLAALGGQLTISSEAGRGVRLTGTIPAAPG